MMEEGRTTAALPPGFPTDITDNSREEVHNRAAAREQRNLDRVRQPHMPTSPGRTEEGKQLRLRKIANLYHLGRKLGSGSFGEIYLAVNTKTNEEFAVKIEKSNARHPQLMYEAKLLKHISGAPGIANVYYYDVEGDYNVMVLDLLGPSLEDLFNIVSRKFSLKTVLMLADQMLHRIEYLHSQNFIHRDIKPDNFLIGRNKKVGVVYLIDFGLAKKYRDPKAHQHIPYIEGKSLTGTARYASINAHVGIEQSRRDDLESIGYVLLYFCRGSLPWQGVKAGTKDEKYKRITEIKQSTSVDALCQGYPSVFCAYMNYCRSLRFEDRPDYGYLRRMYKDLFLREGFANDGIFDWTQPTEQLSGSSPPNSHPLGRDFVPPSPGKPGERVDNALLLQQQQNAAATALLASGTALVGGSGGASLGRGGPGSGELPRLGVHRDVEGIDPSRSAMLPWNARDGEAATAMNRSHEEGEELQDDPASPVRREGDGPPVGRHFSNRTVSTNMRSELCLTNMATASATGTGTNFTPTGVLPGPHGAMNMSGEQASPKDNGQARKDRRNSWDRDKESTAILENLQGPLAKLEAPRTFGSDSPKSQTRKRRTSLASMFGCFKK